MDEIRASLLSAGVATPGASCGGALIRPAAGGVEIPDVLTPGLPSLRRAVELPLGKPALSSLLRLAFGGDGYAFLNSSDAQINMSSTWHRDVSTRGAQTLDYLLKLCLLLALLLLFACSR